MVEMLLSECLGVCEAVPQVVLSGGVGFGVEKGLDFALPGGCGVVVALRLVDLGFQVGQAARVAAVVSGFLELALEAVELDAAVVGAAGPRLGFTHEREGAARPGVRLLVAPRWR